MKVLASYSIKGGVGKTTVACLLAEAARRAGQRVLLAETAPIEAVAARLEPDQVFYDVGSGLGFVTMLVSCLTGVRAVGIEYEPAYHAHAVSRAERLGLERVEYRRGDASEADFEEGDVFFFFDPFRGAIFDAVAAKIQQVALQKTIRIVSRGSSSVAFEALSWLEVESRGPHELLTLRSCAR